MGLAKQAVEFPQVLASYFYIATVTKATYLE